MPIEIKSNGLLCDKHCKHLVFCGYSAHCGLFNEEVMSLDAYCHNFFRDEDCIARDKTTYDEAVKQFKIDANKVLSFVDDNDVEEIIDNVFDGNIDFTVGRYRYIRHYEIEDVLKEELQNWDAYTLGAFSPECIGAALGVSGNTVSLLQDQGGDHNYIGLGEMVKEADYGIVKMLRYIESTDGYSAIFSTDEYDEFNIASIFYCIFQVH